MWCAVAGACTEYIEWNESLLLGEGTGGDFTEGMTSGLNFDANRKMPALQTRRIAPAKVL